MKSIFVFNVTWCTEVSSPVMIWSTNTPLVDLYWIIHSKHKHIGSICHVHLNHLKTNTQPPSCNQKHYEKFHKTLVAQKLCCAPILLIFTYLSSWIMSSHVRCHLLACVSSVRPAWPLWNALHQKKTNLSLITHSLNTARSSLWMWVSVCPHVFRKLITPCTSALAQLSSLAATVIATYALMSTSLHRHLAVTHAGSHTCTAVTHSPAVIRVLVQ